MVNLPSFSPQLKKGVYEATPAAPAWLAAFDLDCSYKSYWYTYFEFKYKQQN